MGIVAADGGKHAPDHAGPKESTVFQPGAEP